MNGFSADPEGLITKGQNVLRIFETYESERDSVATTTDRVASAWEGADATGLVSQIHSYDADFKKLGEVIERIGTILGSHGSRLAETRDNLRDLASRL